MNDNINAEFLIGKLNESLIEVMEAELDQLDEEFLNWSYEEFLEKAHLSEAWKLFQKKPPDPNKKTNKGLYAMSKTALEVATSLLRISFGNVKKAIRRLTFYMNRAFSKKAMRKAKDFGKFLFNKKRLEAVKKYLKSRV